MRNLSVQSLDIATIVQSFPSGSFQRAWRSIVAGFLLILSSFLIACVSSQVTQDLSNGAKNALKWELVTVQADFVGKLDFLAVSEIDGQVLDKPLVFGIDVILLPPGKHELKLVLGKFENYLELTKLSSSSSVWQAELGSISLNEPENSTSKNAGRNYLVASYDKLYTSNSRSPKYMQRWVVNYPRTIDANKKWSIESLDPETSDLDADLPSESAPNDPN